MASKKRIKNQKYEKYWALTLEYEKFDDNKFNLTLKTIIDFIDENPIITSTEYKKLQNILNILTPKKNMASIRKAINQFLKLGFINNKMESYHIKTRQFLTEKDISRKKRIYSEIMYDNASFNRSFTKETNEKEIDFLVKTIEYCGSISKDNLLALIYQNINNYPKGYIELDELENITKVILEEKADKRKYNQRNFLWDICRDILTGIYINKEGRLTLEKYNSIEEKIKKGRDSYKQRLYKYDLYKESIDNNKEVVCYYENKSYPVLIASHIKPYVECEENEKFDADNGLLLSKNIDNLFDNGWITFDDDGTVLCSDNLDIRIKSELQKQKLDKKYLNEKRLKYLKYHRDYVFDSSKEYNYLVIK